MESGTVKPGAASESSSTAWEATSPAEKAVASACTYAAVLYAAGVGSLAPCPRPAAAGGLCHVVPP